MTNQSRRSFLKDSLAAATTAAITPPKVHHCMGGLVTNMKGQVLGVMDQKPIPGIYVAGEATVDVHDAVRLGSCVILDCLVNGRICGQEIIKA